VVSDQVSGETKWFLIRFQEKRSGFRSSLFYLKSVQVDWSCTVGLSYVRVETLQINEGLVTGDWGPVPHTVRTSTLFIQRFRLRGNNISPWFVVL
jgi:hypothetical protein